MTDADPRAGREAARLLAAAQDWLRSSAPHLAPTAPDGEPCSCPVCRAVAGIREVDPEAVGRWVDVAVSSVGALLAQAGDLVVASPEAAAADGPAPAPRDDTGTTSCGGAPDSESARQDGSSPRRVRRVPVTRAEGGDQTTS